MAGTQSIDGLASNLNTTQIIDSIIQAERRSAVLMEQDQANKTKEISTFQSLSAKLLALQSSLAGLGKEATFNQASLSISDENLLSATADGRVTPGSYALRILSLASAHQIASQGYSDPNQAILGTGTITLSLGDRSGTTLTIGQGEGSLLGIKKAINDAKIGITASIIYDGTSSNPYRLVLTGSQTGQKNRISITSNLAGGESLDFQTASFDDPEILRFSAQATSQVALGATAGYTGKVNKTFTFTVGGAGTQTVGQGNIILHWSDGASQGDLVVSQADTEVVGPEGLKLSFADGALVAGDTFQLSTFAPTLQQAADAQVAIGSSIQGASPIVIRSETNTIKDVIPGLTLTLKGVTTDAGGPVTIKTGLDSDAIKGKISALIAAYNNVMQFIDDQNKFNSDTKEAGTLLGDLTLMSVQSRLRTAVSEPVAGLSQKLNTLATIGVRTDINGRLVFRDPSRLTQALEDDFDSVVKLFADSASTSNQGVTFLSAASTIRGGATYAVNITQAATHGMTQGQKINDPAVSPLTLSAADNRLRLRLDGIVSNDIVLTARSYASGEELARELQAKITADTKIGARGVTVEWVDIGDEGFLRLTSATYGATSKVEMIASAPNNAYAKLGLAAAEVHAGDNVAGTINGELATGQGQTLIGKDGNRTTAGLRLSVTLSELQLGQGDDATLTVSRGIASTLGETLDRITKSGDGVIARKTGGLQKQVENIKQQVKDFDARLVLRRQFLTTQFMQMEQTLSQLQSQSSFLDSQLQNISANWSQIKSNG